MTIPRLLELHCSSFYTSNLNSVLIPYLTSTLIQLYPDWFVSSSPHPCPPNANPDSYSFSYRYPQDLASQLLAKNALKEDDEATNTVFVRPAKLRFFNREYEQCRVRPT